VAHKKLVHDWMSSTPHLVNTCRSTGTGVNSLAGIAFEVGFRSVFWKLAEACGCRARNRSGTQKVNAKLPADGTWQIPIGPGANPSNTYS
jgi:hypothetical protein